MHVKIKNQVFYANFGLLRKYCLEPRVEAPKWKWGFEFCTRWDYSNGQSLAQNSGRQGVSPTRNWNNFEFPQSAGTTKLMQGSEYSAKSAIFENKEKVISQKDLYETTKVNLRRDNI